MIKPPPFVLTRNCLGRVGVALVTTAIISWRFVHPGNRGQLDHPHAGMVLFGGVTTPVNADRGTQFNERTIKLTATPQFHGQACYRTNPDFASYLNRACSGLQRADWRDARKHVLLEEVSAPLASPVAI
jgi:hypothetical protein